MRTREYKDLVHKRVTHNIATILYKAGKFYFISSAKLWVAINFKSADKRGNQ